MHQPITPLIRRPQSFPTWPTWPREGGRLLLIRDVFHDYTTWRRLGSLLYIENMDKRKPIGRTVEELEPIFELLPDAKMCFDIAHVREVDTSMTEAYRILKAFRGMIRQIHISAVSSSSKHDIISPNVARSFHTVALLIPNEIPAILETP